MAKGKRVVDLGSVGYLVYNNRSPDWLFKALSSSADKNKGPRLL